MEEAEPSFFPSLPNRRTLIFVSFLFQEEEEFKNKHLDFMSKDLMEVKKCLSDIPQGVLDFLRELLECASNGFTSWIKTIIKGGLERREEGRKSSDSEGHHFVPICPHIQHSVWGILNPLSYFPYFFFIPPHPQTRRKSPFLWIWPRFPRGKTTWISTG